MITIEKNLYALHTRHTSYVFCVMESGHPEHLYYGRRIHAQQTVMMEKGHFFRAIRLRMTAVLKIFHWRIAVLKCHLTEKAISVNRLLKQNM